MYDAKQVENARMTIGTVLTGDTCVKQVRQARDGVCVCVWRVRLHVCVCVFVCVCVCVRARGVHGMASLTNCKITSCPEWKTL